MSSHSESTDPYVCIKLTMSLEDWRLRLVTSDFFFGVGEEFKTIHFTPMGSADYSFALRVQVTPGHLSASASVIVTFWCSHSKLCTFGSWNRCL